MAAVIGLFLIRVAANVSVFEPLQLQTSGFEQESLFAIWKYINGKDVYAFTTDIPYTFSNFNWLYYVFYGSVTGLAMDVMGLADPWLPTVTRMVTLLGAIVGALVTYRIMAGLSDDDAENDIDILAIGLAVLVFFGPLAGFWTITTRPDIWSTVIEAILVFGFMRLYLASALKAALWALVWGYAAWAFKTVDVTVVGGVGIFLLWRRDWLAAGTLAMGTLGLWLMTYWLGTDAYQFSMLGAHQEIAFALGQGIRNLVNFGIKMLPVLLPTVLVAWFILRTRAVRLRVVEDWQLQFLLIVSVCSLGISVLGSFKVGGAENYFFTPSLILALLVHKMWMLFKTTAVVSGIQARAFCVSLIAGWLLTGTATASVMAGMNGVISQRAMHDHVTQMQPCLGTLPQPIFINDMNLSLPWITPSEENFLLSFYYRSDRAAGREFEQGGIGGLIEAGYFGAIVFMEPRATFDGSSLDGYTLQSSSRCGGWAVYLKAAQP